MLDGWGNGCVAVLLWLRISWTDEGERRTGERADEEIAKMLGIGLSVEKEHVRATFAKIGAANRSEAVAIALRKHLLKI